MHLTQFAIARQAACLNQLTQGLRVTDSFSQARNEWVIMLANRQEEAGALKLNSDAQFPYIVFLPNARRKRNAAPVMTRVIGRQISRISGISNDRIMEIYFAGADERLQLQFFPLKTNFFFADSEQNILEAFKGAGKIASVSENISSQPESLFDFQSLFRDLQAVNSDSSLDNAFRIRPALSATMRREVLARAGLDRASRVGDLQIAGLKALAMVIANLVEEVAVSQPRIYQGVDLQETLLFCASEQPQLTEKRVFEDPNSALRSFCGQAIRNRDVQQKRDRQLRALDRKISRLEKTRKQLQGTNIDPEKQEMLNRIGQLLVSQPFPAHQKKVKIVDYYDPEMPEIEVMVEPALTPQENAEIYFRKARQYGEKVESYHQQGAVIERQLAELSALRAEVVEADSLKILGKSENRLMEGGILQPPPGKREEYRKPYREFSVDGFRIWVGRSAKDNDQLTFREAHKEDLWLHVQGYSGSHVVIRLREKGKDRLPQRVLHIAARLAVTFSTARHASYVPVLYGAVKYVRKPRKSAPGTVVTEQMKTIFADPFSREELSSLGAEQDSSG